MSDEKPKVAYWHLHVGSDGVSRQTRCAMTDFELKAIGPHVSPQWQGRKVASEATIFTTVLPVGWTGTWHENPKPQWIIPLSGRWFVESMDGQRVEMGVGELAFGEDQGTTEHDGRKGHCSGTVGGAPVVLMIVQFDQPLPQASSCRFR